MVIFSSAPSEITGNLPKVVYFVEKNIAQIFINHKIHVCCLLQSTRRVIYFENVF